MLALRTVLSTALGSSFTCTAGGRTFTVTVGWAGTEDEETAVLPAIFIGGAEGKSPPSNLGGGGVENETTVELQIVAVNDGDVRAPIIIDAAHAVAESLIRAGEKTTGSSYFTLVSSHRDESPELLGGIYEHTRILEVRGINVEKY